MKEPTLVPGYPDWAPMYVLSPLITAGATHRAACSGQLGRTRGRWEAGLDAGSVQSSLHLRAVEKPTHVAGNLLRAGVRAVTGADTCLLYMCHYAIASG